MELKIIESTLPSVKSNFEELKTQISELTTRYKNLVVTEETQADCKKTKQELSKLEKQIDRFRIDKAKELAAPIAVFEDQMKELKSLVTSVVDPIDKQLKVFGEERKNKRREAIKALIASTVASYQLDDKHASQLTLDESYLNKTATDGKIITDLKNRAEVIKTAQNTYASNRQLIEHACQSLGDIKLDAKPWLMMFDRNGEVAEILNAINDEKEKKREAIFEAERQQAKQEQEQLRLQLEEVQKSKEVVYHPPQKTQEVFDKLVLDGKIDTSGKPTNWATFKVMGRKQQLIDLGDYMNAKGIKFEVIEKGEL